MKIVLLTIWTLFLILPQFSFGQQLLYARADGLWNAGTTWSLDGITSCGCTPTSIDDVYTNGFSVSVSGASSVNNLYIFASKNGSLLKSGLGTKTITIFGELGSYSGPIGFEVFAIPAGPIITVGGLNFVFNGTNPVGTSIIEAGGWGPLAPLPSFTFNPTIPGIALSIDENIALGSSTIMTVNAGTLDINGVLQSSSASATISINTGATLVVNGGSITGISGNNTTSFPTLVVNGTLTSANNNTSFVNAATINLNAGSVFNVGYNGVNQTQGWWYQGNSPATANLDLLSTVNYNSSVSQNVFAQSYGNLTLGGSSTTKTVSGAGSINIKGNLLFSNTSVIFTAPASNPVIFDGTGAQSISGGGSANTNFNGGLQVNKSTGTLTLGQNISIQNGLTLTAGAGAFDLGSNTIDLSGNLVNNATLTPSNSTLSIISGSTTISGSSLTSLGNLTITPTGSLVASASLSVKGDFTNNGSFNANNGTVTFDGPSPQIIHGSTNTNFNNIIYNNNSSLTISAPQSLTGALSITTSSGVFNANGNLTLLSTSTSDARIAQITSGGSISGNVTVQRYLPNAGSLRAYRYLASPVTNATVSQWKATFPITGTFNDPSTVAEWPAFPTLIQGNPSMYSYNEAHTPTTTVEDRFETFPPNGSSTSATALVNGKGYSAFVRQQASPITLSVTGAPQQGSVGVAVTAQSGGGNDGWNLIGNPYPSPINWANVTVPSGVSNSIVIKDNTNNFGQGAGTFVSYAGGVGIPNTYTGTISSGQAFWVRATSGATIIFQEDDKVATSNPKFVRQETLSNLIRVNLSGNGKSDEAVVRFVHSGNDYADNNYDAFKLKNDYINLASFSSDNKKLAINGMGALGCSSQVKLDVSDTKSGTYQLSFSNYESFTSGVAISLLDKVSNTTQDVRTSPSYSFSINENDPSTFGADRFVLQFSYQSAAIDLNSIEACLGSDAHLTLKNSQPDLTYTFFSNGARLIDPVIGNGGDVVLGIASNKLKEGINSININAVSSTCNSITAAKSIEIKSVAAPSSSSILATNGQTCKTGTVTLKATGAPTDGSYRWYTSNNAPISIVGASSGTYVTSVLSKNTSFYVSILNSLGCESTKKEVVAEIISFNDATIEQLDNITLSSNFATGNQWYKDGKMISGATNQQLKIDGTGTYLVDVAVGICHTSTEAPFVVTGLEDTGKSDEISVYPNPIISGTVSIIVAASTMPTVVLSNSTGQSIGEFTILKEGSRYKGNFDLASSASGIYFIQVIDGKTGFVTVKKIIKN
jgi:hypothetical protein